MQTSSKKPSNATGGTFVARVSLLAIPSISVPSAEPLFELPEEELMRPANTQNHLLILARTTSDLLLTKVYSSPARSHMWTAPVAAGGDPVHAADDLLEQAGARAVSRLASLGTIHPAPQSLPVTFTSWIVTSTEPKQLVSVANSDLRWIPIEEALAACSDGTMTDAATVAAVFRARTRGLL